MLNAFKVQCRSAVLMTPDGDLFLDLGPSTFCAVHEDQAGGGGRCIFYVRSRPSRAHCIASAASTLLRVRRRATIGSPPHLLRIGCTAVRSFLLVPLDRTMLCTMRQGWQLKVAFPSGTTAFDAALLMTDAFHRFSHLGAEGYVVSIESLQRTAGAAHDVRDARARQQQQRRVAL